MALAATLHDPDGALLEEIQARLPDLRLAFSSLDVATSPPTDRRVVELLARHDAWCGTPRRNLRGPLYRDCLAAAARRSAGRVQYLDFDRALHFAKRAPRRLMNLTTQLARVDAAVTVVGRTPDAHASHQAALYRTEVPVNSIFAAALGLPRPLDFLAPSFVLASSAAAALAAASIEPDAGIYGELPVLLAAHASRRGELNYLESADLDWETPDRDPARVRRIGIERYRRRFDSPAEWQMRSKLAGEIVVAFAAALARIEPGRIRMRGLERKSRSRTRG